MGNVQKVAVAVTGGLSLLLAAVTAGTAASAGDGVGSAAPVAVPAVVLGVVCLMVVSRGYRIAKRVERHGTVIEMYEARTANGTTVSWTRRLTIKRADADRTRRWWWRRGGGDGSVEPRG